MSSADSIATTAPIEEVTVRKVNDAEQSPDQSESTVCESPESSVVMLDESPAADETPAKESVPAVADSTAAVSSSSAMISSQALSTGSLSPAATTTTLVSFEAAKELLLKGEPLAYPTDTVWGIGCLADSEEWVKKCLQKKEWEGQSGKKMERTPVCSVILPGMETIQNYVKFDSLTSEAQELMKTVLPGCYSFILPLNTEEGSAGAKLTHIAGPGPSLGVRIINLPEVMDLVKACDRPLITTSLNKTGTPSATCFAEAKAVAEQMGIGCVEYDDSSESSAEKDGDEPCSQKRRKVDYSKKIEKPAVSNSSTLMRWDQEQKKFQILRPGAGAFEHLLEQGIAYRK